MCVVGRNCLWGIFQNCKEGRDLIKIQKKFFSPVKTIKKNPKHLLFVTDSDNGSFNVDVKKQFSW